MPSQDDEPIQSISNVMPPPPASPFVLDESGECTRLVLSGTVSIRTARAFHAVVVDAASRGLPVTVDASALDRLDTTAIQLLLALERSQADAGLTFTVEGVTLGIRRSLQLAGLGRLLEPQVAQHATTPPRPGETDG